MFGEPDPPPIEHARGTCQCDHSGKSYVAYIPQHGEKLCVLCGKPLSEPRIASLVSKTFAYHQPSLESGAKIRRIREQFTALQGLIEATCPVSRECSVALTELETAAMWAIKSIVANDPASTPEP